jgi:hypothetical protein
MQCVHERNFLQASNDRFRPGLGFQDLLHVTHQSIQPLPGRDHADGMPLFRQGIFLIERDDE